MAQIVVALVAGLPAYVMVKILNPGFFAREDTRTPVWTALVVADLQRRAQLHAWCSASASSAWPAATACFGQRSTACCSMPSCTGAAGSTSPPSWPAGSPASCVATAAMARAAVVADAAAGRRATAARVIDRVWSLSLLVGARRGGVLRASPSLIGALDKDLIAQLRRRRPPRDQGRRRNPRGQNKHPCVSFPASSPPAISTSAITWARSATGCGCRTRWRQRRAVPVSSSPISTRSASRTIPAELAANTREMVAALVACGIDPATLDAVQPGAGSRARRAAMAAQRHRADGLAEPHDPVEGQGRQEPRGRSRSRCSPIRCCRPPTCCSIRRPTCRWARTRSSTSNWPATSPRSSTTISAREDAPVFTLPDPIIPPEAARIMSLRDGTRQDEQVRSLAT